MPSKINAVAADSIRQCSGCWLTNVDESGFCPDCGLVEPADVKSPWTHCIGCGREQPVGSSWALTPRGIRCPDCK